MYWTLIDLKRFNKNGITLDRDRLPHAMIIEGGSKNERMLCAIDICKFIECEENGCHNSQCTICRKIDNNTLSDITTICQEGKSIGVESIRKMIEDTLVLPNESNFKVYIIKDAETMTLQAQNAILKTLEEPPRFVKFILLCDTAGKMLDTIRSRTSIYSLNASDNNCDSDEILEASRKFMMSMIYNSQLSSLSLCDGITKDRKFFQESLECISDCYENCISYFYNRKEIAEEEKEFYSKVLDKISIQKILKIIEILNELKILAKKNANMNLLSTVMHFRLLKVVNSI